MNFLRSGFLLFFLFVPNALFAEPGHYILALSKAEKKLFVLDYRTLDLTTKIPVGEDPHEIVISLDGSRAFVSNPQMNASGHEINVIDLTNLKAEKSVDTRPFYIPHGMVLRSDSLWYTAQGSKSVVLYNTSKNEPQQVFGTGQDFTHLIWLSKDGNKFCTTNVESGTVSVFERKEIPPYLPPTGVLPANAKPRVEWRQTLIDAGFGCEGFDVSEDETELWTARPDGEIVIIDLLKKKIKSKIDTKVHGLHRLKFTTDGKTVCAVSVKTGDILFFDRSAKKLQQTIRTGHGAGIYMDPNGSRMFISCTPDNFIAVFDLRTKTEIRRIEIGRPDAVTSVITRR